MMRVTIALLAACAFCALLAGYLKQPEAMMAAGLSAAAVILLQLTLGRR